MFAVGLVLFVLAWAGRHLIAADNMFIAACGLGGAALMLVSVVLLAWKYLP